MKKLLLLTITFLSFVSSSISQETYSRIKLYGTDAELYEATQLGVTLDHGQHKRDLWFIADLSESEIEILQTNGYNFEILIADVSAYYVENSTSTSHMHKDDRSACPGAGGTAGFAVTSPVNWQLGSMAGFYTYQEFLDELDSMASKYPNLISSRAPISAFNTHDGNPIYWLRISDNPNSDEAEEEVLYTALHHSREPASLSQLIFYMWWILENYGTDPEVTYLVDETEMYFVPMINPDGYKYNELTNPGGGGMHRKNRRNVGTSNKGVDLNRNYSHQWGTTGISFTPNNDTYCGTAAFTEPETQAIKWFCENHDFQFAFNAHTHGNLLLFPFGWSDTDFAPDHDYMQAFSNHMVIFNGYSAVKSSDLYPASGDSDDYMYADDLVIKPKIYALTPECSSEGTSNDFWPPQSAIYDICAINIWMNKTLAHMPHVYGVTTDQDQNQVATTSGYFHYEIERLGLEDGDITVSMTALSGIQSLGSANIHTLNLMDIELDSISFVLNPGIQFGDEIKYLLQTDNGLWTKTDTITKTFGAGTAVFTDDCADMTNWTATGQWDFTSEEFVTPSTSITDSPGSNYQNNVSSDIELNQSFSFENATYAYIQFQAMWEIENDWDFVQFMASLDGGISWTPLCGKYTNPGSSDQDFENPLYDNFQSNWVLEEIDLTNYIGETDVRFRFYFYSDGGVTEEGFYFDDFAVYTDHINDASLSEFESSTVSVFPNPASNLVTLQFSNLNALSTVEIYNELGALVTTIQPQQNLTQLNIQAWSEGVYFVKTVSSANEVLMTRFVIVR
ncbi:MAG: immune inhibitor A [Crocinitomicaceae bacterium]|nr:immune inhibitor A [Crocinitomicaceae bacterium]